LQSERKNYHVGSAGSAAVDGVPASPLAVEVANANAIDLTKHQARFLSRTLVGEADLIIALAASHRDTVGVIEPSALAYVYLLTDFCDDVEGDVTDPIGMGREVYEQSFALIAKCIERMQEKLDAFDGWKNPDTAK
jgi:protein-tyrosine phosphatase